MKKKALLRVSVALNIILVSLVLSFAYSYRDRLIQYYVRWRGNYQVIMYGDSMTYLGNWAELLGRTDVLNLGLSGLCTHHLRTLNNQMVVERHPKICFVMAGINDITVGVAPERIQANYAAILDALLANRITPVVTLTLYERKGSGSTAEVQRLNDFLINFCTQKKISYINLNPVLCDSTELKPEFSVDQTHLNNRAYRFWAREVDKQLKKFDKKH